MSDDDAEAFGEFDDAERYDDEEQRPLDGRESALVRQDLRDLERFEDTFASEGYRGVAIFCQDCQEEHFYPWAMLRENLRVLLETGETPVHEPAFAPDPDDYVPWEYARGYADALADIGVTERTEVDACPRCKLRLHDEQRRANFCPRCGTALLRERLRRTLETSGMGRDEIHDVLRQSGLPG